MRKLCVSCLIVLAGLNANAQGAAHEYRPEVVLTLPRVDGYALQLLVEQHLATSDLFPNERTLGVGVSGPLLGRFRPVFEIRQVQQPTSFEHRYIPTVLWTVALPGEFELRSRTRVEIRDINGEWSERWQDRTAFGRDIEVGGVKAFTYVQGDAYLDSRYNTINRLDKTAGTRVPITSGSSIDLYFSRIDDTRKAQRTVYAYGMLLRVAM